LHSLNLLELSLCKHHIEKDQSTFGVKCTSTLSQFEEVVVKHTTDIERLRQETSPGPAILIITNATLLTMSTGTPDDVIRDGILFVQDGVITGVYGDEDDVVLPQSAVVIDAKGAFITPGFIDVHAHWGGFDSAYPARSWELETFLAYGVTTLHK
jgi:adenine deaminase